MSHRRNVRKNCCGDLVTHLLRLRFTPEEIEQRDKSRKIDKFLEKDKNSFRRQVTFPFFSPFNPISHHRMIFHDSDSSLFVSHFYYRTMSIARELIVYCLHIFCYFISLLRHFLGKITIAGRWRVRKVNFS